MQEYFSQLLEKIKLQDRDKVLSDIKARIENYREWLQDNGEWSLVVGIFAGIVLVLFFRVLLLLAVLVAVASYLIWNISGPAKPPEN